MKDKITKALGSVTYPGFKKDIITLGLIEEFSVDGKKITLKMKQLHADDKVRDEIASKIKDALIILDLEAEIVFPESAKQKPPASKMPLRKKIAGVDKVIPVASGKGGVGKSTVSVNLAISLANEGNKVGLLDLDLYGPSIPTMLALEGPMESSENKKLKPMEKFGIKVVSIGFLMPKGEALAWRGPMLGKIMKQFFYDVDWGELDYLILDLPPGTGDVQLTLAQSLPTFGAVVVTTPQDVALADVEKAMSMFGKTGDKILGIVENMSGFICPHCNEESQIFGSGGGERESKRSGVPLLGKIPLEPSITKTGDSGEPLSVEKDSQTAKLFASIAKEIIKAG